MQVAEKRVGIRFSIAPATGINIGEDSVNWPVSRKLQAHSEVPENQPVLLHIHPSSRLKKDNTLWSSGFLPARFYSV
jgi:hypothetical protein